MDQTFFSKELRKKFGITELFSSPSVTGKYFVVKNREGKRYIYFTEFFSELSVMGQHFVVMNRVNKSGYT